MAVTIGAKDEVVYLLEQVSLVVDALRSSASALNPGVAVPAPDLMAIASALLNGEEEVVLGG